MSDALILRKGKLANLDSAGYVPGAISITTDECAMYLDLDTSTRIRLGDFIQVDTLDDLVSDQDLSKPLDDTKGRFTPWSETAFYYVKDVNALLKWNGTHWVQVNESAASQEGMTNLSNRINELSGLVNSLSGTVTSLNNSKQDKINFGEDGGEKVVITTADGQLTFSNISAASLAYLDINGSLSAIISGLNSSITSLQQGLEAEISRATMAEDSIRAEFASADTALKTDITNEYVSYIAQQLQIADAMTYKGVAMSPEDLGVVGNSAGEKVSAGWTYKVGDNFAMNGKGVFVGDLLIAHSDQGPSDETYLGTWDHVQSGFEADNDPYFIAETANDENNIPQFTGSINLANAVGQTRGKIKFDTAKSNNSNIVAELSTEALDQVNGIYETNVSFKMVWGDF